MSYILIFVCLFILLVSSGIGQEDEPILACINDVGWLAFHVNYTDDWWGVPDDVHDTFLELIGEPIQYSYNPDSWDIPDDAQAIFKLIGRQNGAMVEVWFWGAPSELEFVYVFPFANTRLFADAEGNHYGKHPCGGWRVDYDTVMLLVLQIVQ